MREPSIRDFRVTANQYELFRFIITRPTKLRIEMIATAPVNLVLLDSDDRVEYENRRKDDHPYAAAWARRKRLETTVPVDPGTWYLAVEGSSEESSGRIEVLQ